jgi:regulator of replication initiation timing
MTLAQKSDRILAQTRGLSGATPNATQLIEELRSALEAYRQENATLTAERDEARRLLKAVVDMMRDNMAPDANSKASGYC